MKIIAAKRKDEFLDNKWLVMRYLLAVAVLFWIGVKLLIFAVSDLGIGKMEANVGLAPIMGALAYLVQRFFVYRKRRTRLKESGPRWFYFRVACFAAGQTAFIVLVELFSVSYVDARVYVGASLGLILLVLTPFIINKYILPQQAEKL